MTDVDRDDRIVFAARLGVPRAPSQAIVKLLTFCFCGSPAHDDLITETIFAIDIYME